VTSRERDVGCVMNGTRDRQVERTGVCLPKGDGA
jgi:hypothetical protein